MLITTYSEFLEKLESTTKRLEITDILADLINQLDKTEVQNAINLTLGQLYAPHNNLNFNIAEKMMIRALALANNLTIEEVTSKYKQLGDLGDTAQELSTKKTSDLSINQTHELLKQIAVIEGTGSQDKKIEKLSKLLNLLDASSAKYITRMILGTTRLGFTALTIIDALSKNVAGDKSKKTQIEQKFNIHPDIGLIVEKIKTNGLDAISQIETQIGVPILSQKPQRVEGPEEVFEKMDEEKVWVEYKLDGTRVQFHFDRNKKDPKINKESLFNDNDSSVFTRAYTRNLDETSHQYPDLIQGLIDQIDAQSVILDGEAIGYDKETGKFLDFQQTITRKRKHDVAQTADEVPLKYYVFDILYLNGQSLIEKPLKERKQILSKIIKKGAIITPDEYFEVSTPDQITKIFIEAKNHNLEGLVIKNPNKPYEAGARSYSWVKIKRIVDENVAQNVADSIDCVIMGYNTGKGARAEFGIGAFLAGIYDENTLNYKTITKVGSGMKEEDLEILKKLCDQNKSNQKPNNYNVDKSQDQDVWVLPKIVVELRADEITISPTHTSGFALRFPRLLKIRNDKNAQQTTSPQEVSNLFKMQKN